MHYFGVMLTALREHESLKVCTQHKVATVALIAVETS